MHDRVLFVCVGNIYRNPTAEALWNFKRQQIGPVANVWSTGIGAEAGRESHQDTGDLLLLAGVDASANRSQPLRSAMLRWCW
ncbi:MAG: hypothetical protein FJ189_07100 [Gammaproteobacteria bacterium]|nr:hypothetical protein [Gammaproteobacteria bacterium]